MLLVACLCGRSKAPPGQYISYTLFVKWPQGNIDSSLGKYRYFPVATWENIDISLWPCDKGADRVQLNSKYTSKGNSRGTGQLYHDSQGC